MGGAGNFYRAFVSYSSSFSFSFLRICSLRIELGLLPRRAKQLLRAQDTKRRRKMIETCYNAGVRAEGRSMSLLYNE